MTGLTVEGWKQNYSYRAAFFSQNTPTGNGGVVAEWIKGLFKRAKMNEKLKDFRLAPGLGNLKKITTATAGLLREHLVP